jgi:hypothetical protein
MINNTADPMTSASYRRPCQVSLSLAPRCSRRGSRRGGGSVRGRGLLRPGGTAGSMGPCGPERGGGLESPIRHSGIPRRFSIRPSRQSTCWSMSLSVGDSDIGSSRSSLGPEDWDGQPSSPSSTHAGEAKDPTRLEPATSGIRESAQRCRAPFEASVWARFPRLCAQTDVSPEAPHSIYAPRVLTCQGVDQSSDLSSITSSAPGFSFLAMVMQ